VVATAYIVELGDNSELIFFSLDTTGHITITVYKQEIRLLLTNRATHLCNMQWRGWPLEHVSFPDLLTCTIWLFLCQRVYKYIGTSKIVEHWGHAPCDGRRGYKTSPFAYVLLCRIWSL